MPDVLLADVPVGHNRRDRTLYPFVGCIEGNLSNKSEICELFSINFLTLARHDHETTHLGRVYALFGVSSPRVCVLRYVLRRVKRVRETICSRTLLLLVCAESEAIPYFPGTNV